MDDKSRDYVLTCSACTLCKDCCYQSPPISYAGDIKSKILVIGQNPGEVSETDINRVWWNHYVNQSDKTPELMKGWYDWDFGTSYGAAKLQQLFGKDWTKEGFCFSNAVRCRTVANSKPNDEFIANCTQHTERLISLWSEANPDPKRRALIVMGAVARWQVFKSFKLLPNWGELKFSSRFGHVMAIKHYAAWKGDLPQYQATVKQMLKAIS